jgi:RNAse (barnase) inhibitor barstar
MNKEPLFLPRSPWVYVISASPSDITNLGWSLMRRESQRVVVRFLRGNKMKRVSSLFDEFAAALQFPFYCGENWNALDECMVDLSWLPADVYILLITNAQAFLAEEDEEQFSALTGILQNAAEEWSRRVEVPEWRRRPPVPFHIIFQCLESDLGVVMLRLKTTGITFQEIRLDAAEATGSIGSSGS